MDSSDLASYVGAKVDGSMAAAWATAVALVNAYLMGHASNPLEPWTTPDVPPAVIDRAYLEVGAELYHRKNAKNGVTQFATADSVAPVRIARDPLIAARPILAPFLLRGGFA